jgi:hypothetical protein
MGPNPLRRSLPAIFTVALLFRVVLLVFLFHESTMNRGFVHSEAANIAESLVLHHAYAGAYFTTQPTAWLAPVYPAVTAVVFQFFGVKSFASIVVLASLNALFAALTSIYLCRIAANRFGQQTGFVAGWIWALCPYIALIPFVIWDTCLAGLIFAYAVWKLLSIEHCLEPRKWIECGIIWGLLALTSPVLLAPLPAWTLYWIWKKPSRLAPMAVMALTVFLCAAPWCLRNALVVGTGFSPRSNAWAEVYYGEAGFAEHGNGPSGEYQRLGEAKYVALLKQRTQTFIRTHPREFLTAALHRVVPFWTVPWPFTLVAALLILSALASLLLAPWEKVAPLAFILFFCPLIYYFCYSFSRYRYPVDAMVCVLAGYSVTRAFQWMRLT